MLGFNDNPDKKIKVIDFSQMTTALCIQTCYYKKSIDDLNFRLLVHHTGSQRINEHVTDILFLTSRTQRMFLLIIGYI